MLDVHLKDSQNQEMVRHKFDKMTSHFQQIMSVIVMTHGSANGHCTASQYSAIPKHRVLLTRTNQKIHHNFSVFEYMKIAQNYAEVSLPSPHSI